MGINDPVGNMLTIIRNGMVMKFTDVAVPFSKLSENIINVLVKEGFVKGVEKINSDESKFSKLKVYLKYDNQGKSVIHSIDRVSKPGRRIYVEKKKVPRYKSGFGTMILTTSKGVLSGRDARMQNVGGEILCKVW